MVRGQPSQAEELSTSLRVGPPERLTVPSATGKLTHYLFRYPAKFHPPVARMLLEEFTQPDDVVFDPFCGSGTLLVEALVAGRESIGIDVDPVAAAVSRAKTHRYRVEHLRKSAEVLFGRLDRLERAGEEYSRRDRAAKDITEADYKTAAVRLQEWIPAIPNLLHWFRRYVVIDLAWMRQTIAMVDIPETHRQLFAVVFASIIRNASNADPVPVSGLEVTAHMLRREEGGRVVNPFALFRTALARAVTAHEALADNISAGTVAHVVQGDATDLARHLKRKVNAVITSPPYHGAVDYYRRHQLEMYWLGVTRSHADRLLLLKKYVGRPKVPHGHPFVSDGVLATALAKEWEGKIRNVDAKRADAFRHYLIAMTQFFDGLAPHLERNAPVVLVLGQSSWNQSQIPTTDLFAEIASGHFRLERTCSYPVRNRYMSYSRRNGAGIDTEYVLVLRRR